MVWLWRNRLGHKITKDALAASGWCLACDEFFFMVAKAQAVTGSNTKYRNACLAIREQQVGHMYCKRLVHRIYNDSATR